MQKAALISVYDKSGIIKLAQGLIKFDYQIIATDKTASVLEEAKIKVDRIQTITKTETLLGGRVKTLHPYIFCAILADLDEPQHLVQLKELQIPPIGVVVVNLYPFAQILKEKADQKTLIENIDIGGHALLRAAAKNYKHVCVLCRVSQYDEFLSQLEKYKETSLDFRKKLASEAFAYLAEYDILIDKYFQQEDFPQIFNLTMSKKLILRYGENPHQKAAYYTSPLTPPPFKQIWGKDLSYNNILDIHAAATILNDFADVKENLCTVIKHANPAAVALGKSQEKAFLRAWSADEIAAFGSVVGFNAQLTIECAQRMHGKFIECIVAPSFSNLALDFLKEKSKNIRLVEYVGNGAGMLQLRSVYSGVLVQQPDEYILSKDNVRIVTNVSPTEEQMSELFFAWKVVKNLQSNAIVITKDRCTKGIGAGQPSRIAAAQLAICRAGDCHGCVLASDGFFPFADVVEVAAEAGIEAIIQPGGSIRDEEVIAAANKAKIPLVFTSVRHFKH